MRRMYKGKSITTNADVVGYYVCVKGKEYIYPAEGSARQECKNIEIQTGFKDRNGKDIYTNDTIKLISPKSRKVVYTSKVEDINGAFQYTDINGYNALLFTCNMIVEVQDE